MKRAAYVEERSPGSFRRDVLAHSIQLTLMFDEGCHFEKGLVRMVCALADISVATLRNDAIMGLDDA